MSSTPRVLVPGGGFAGRETSFPLRMRSGRNVDVTLVTEGDSILFKPKAPFDPVSMCVMEVLDKATFAQVPLRLTGDPAHPVEVRPGALAD